MTRGEVWLCALDPTVGAEIRKTRPCLIVSPDEMNRGLRTVIVAPITSAGGAAGFRIPVTFRRIAGLILPDQMRALDRTRLIRRLGTLDPAAVATVLKVLVDIFEP